MLLLHLLVLTKMRENLRLHPKKWQVKIKRISKTKFTILSLNLIHTTIAHSNILCVTPSNCLLSLGNRNSSSAPPATTNLDFTFNLQRKDSASC